MLVSTLLWEDISEPNKAPASPGREATDRSASKYMSTREGFGERKSQVQGLAARVEPAVSFRVYKGLLDKVRSEKRTKGLEEIHCG